MGGAGAVASFASVGREVTLKDQMEASMVLQPGDGQVEMQENLPRLRNGKKAGGAGWKGKLVTGTGVSRSHRTCRA